MPLDQMETLKAFILSDSHLHLRRVEEVLRRNSQLVVRGCFVRRGFTR